MLEPGAQHHDKLFLARWAASNLLGNWDRIDEGDEEMMAPAADVEENDLPVAGGRMAAGDASVPAADETRAAADALGGRTAAAGQEFGPEPPRSSQSGAYCGASSAFRDPWDGYVSPKETPKFLKGLEDAIFLFFRGGITTRRFSMASTSGLVFTRRKYWCAEDEDVSVARH